jgi:hypothetical protein
MPMLRVPAAALLFTLVVSFAACGGGSDDDDPTPTTEPAATAEPTSGAPSDAIRSIDLESTQAVQDFVAEIGGTYVQANVLYADLTDDNIEDAVVPLSSDGTLGDVGFIVVTPEGDDDASELLSVDASEFGVSVGIEGGKLVTVEPVPGPDDPNCCPSQIKTTIYAWDGDELAVESETTAENPAGGAKTPSAEGE